MSKILAIETATEACSAALMIGENVITRIKLAPREHTKLILPMMDEVLEEAGIALEELDAIAFSRGPGAFTGLRIAAGVAQGAALSVGIPVIPVSTLAALAAQAVSTIFAGNDDVIISALDARMGEVYWGVYRLGESGIELVGDEQVSKPQDMLSKAEGLESLIMGNRVLAIGPGWDAYEEALFKKGKMSKLTHLKSALPSAEAIVYLAETRLLEGKAVAPEEAQPVYIRNNVAKKSNKK